MIPLGALSHRQWEDEEIVFSRSDYGEEAAVGRDGKIAEAETMQDGNGRRLRNRNGLSGRYGGEWR